MYEIQRENFLILGAIYYSRLSIEELYDVYGKSDLCLRLMVSYNIPTDRKNDKNYHRNFSFDKLIAINDKLVKAGIFDSLKEFRTASQEAFRKIMFPYNNFNLFSYFFDNDNTEMIDCILRENCMYNNFIDKLYNLLCIATFSIKKYRYNNLLYEYLEDEDNTLEKYLKQYNIDKEDRLGYELVKNYTSCSLNNLSKEILIKIEKLFDCDLINIMTGEINTNKVLLLNNIL